MKAEEIPIKPRNYHDVYYGREDVAIKSIKELPGSALGVKVVLFSPAGSVSHFL
jgi:hypothetical protein